MSVLKAFNNHFTEFMDDISTIFPNNRDIKKSAKGVEMLIKANPRKLIVVWKECVVIPYREKIINGDISFFLNKDYNQDLTSNGVNTNEIMSIIEKLRKDISMLDTGNQEKAMKYVQNLTKLSDLYN